MNYKVIVARVLQLENENKQNTKEYQQLMSDPYIYDKVTGIKQGGIL